MSVTGQPEGPALQPHSYTVSFGTSRDVPSSEGVVTAEVEGSEGEGGETEVFYDVECEEAPGVDAVLPKGPSSKERAKQKKKSCCGCDLTLESSDSGTTSVVRYADSLDHAFISRAEILTRLALALVMHGKRLAFASVFML